MFQFIDLKTFNAKQCFILAVLFMVSVGLHTLTHELGHFSFAHALGYKNITLHYACVRGTYPQKERLDSLSKRMRESADHKQDEAYPEFKKAVRRKHISSFWFTAGGQIVNLMIGLIGLALLRISLTDSFLVSLPQKLKFCLAIALPKFFTYFCFIVLDLIRGSDRFRSHDSFGMGYDFRMLFFSNQPSWDYSFIILNGIIGSIALIYLFWYALEPSERITVWAAALCGIPLGVYLWYGPLGSFLLP